MRHFLGNLEYDPTIHPRITLQMNYKQYEIPKCIRKCNFYILTFSYMFTAIFYSIACVSVHVTQAFT